MFWLSLGLYSFVISFDSSSSNLAKSLELKRESSSSLCVMSTSMFTSSLSFSSWVKSISSSPILELLRFFGLEDEDPLEIEMTSKSIKK